MGIVDTALYLLNVVDRPPESKHDPGYPTLFNIEFVILDPRSVIGQTVILTIPILDPSPCPLFNFKTNLRHGTSFSQ